MATANSTVAPQRLNIAKEVASLQRMTVGELKEKYAEVCGEPTNSHHKRWLVRRIIWRMQALAEGDLTDRARKRAAELANDANIRRTAPKPVPTATAPKAPTDVRSRRLPSFQNQRVPIPGSVITRMYKAQLLEVHVRNDGFEFEGEKYKSLSALANKITGTHCNGYQFFRLHRNGVPNE